MSEPLPPPPMVDETVITTIENSGRLVHCWWCGRPATVDPTVVEDAGMIRDSDTSWLCSDNDACSRRAVKGRWGRRR